MEWSDYPNGRRVPSGRAGSAIHASTVLRGEIRAYLTILAEAARLAGEGNAAGGYERLLVGRQGALSAQRLGTPWAQELAGLWQSACDDYVKRHGTGRA